MTNRNSANLNLRIRPWHLGIVALFLLGLTSNAQSLRLNICQGLLFHQTQFTNSAGQVLDYTSGITTSNGFEVGLGTKSGLSIQFGLSNYSLSTGYSDASVSTEIELGFLRPSLSAAYYFQGRKVVYPSFSLGLGYGMLIQGIQRLDNQIINLIQQDLLGNDLHVWSKIALNFKATDHLVFGVGYLFQKSLNDLEMDAVSQETKFLLHGLEAQLGIRLE